MNIFKLYKREVYNEWERVRIEYETWEEWWYIGMQQEAELLGFTGVSVRNVGLGK